MTHAAPRRRAKSAWRLPVVALVAIGVAVGLGLVSRAVLLDFLAWWPIWLVLAGLSYWGKGRKLGPVRISGLISITSVLVLGLFLLGHFQGWNVLPSSADGLSGGSDDGVIVAAISIGVDGDLSVGVGTPGTIYEISSIRRGGPVGLPTAVERIQDDMISIEVTPTEEPGLYRFAGWDLALSASPDWSLNLRGQLDADLTDLKVKNLQIEGGGALILGTVPLATPVAISGDFIISVPPSQPVRVIGPAEVPQDWLLNESGSTAPTEGRGWIISVPEGFVLQIEYTDG